MGEGWGCNDKRFSGSGYCYGFKFLSSLTTAAALEICSACALWEIFLTTEERRFLRRGMEICATLLLFSPALLRAEMVLKELLLRSV